MKPHDCESLNDFQCWHVEHFRAQLDLWRSRNMGEASCYKLARIDAQKRFPLEGEEVYQMDEYVESRFGTPKVRHRPEGSPAPMMVVT